MCDHRMVDLTLTLIVNNSALTLWCMSIDSFWSLSSFQSKHHKSAAERGKQLDFSPSLLPFAWAAHSEALGLTDILSWGFYQ